eukprot:COSAG02_NODE_986_length_15452_cov_17.818602_11_plen_1305_part_00
MAGVLSTSHKTVQLGDFVSWVDPDTGIASVHGNRIGGLYFGLQCSKGRALLINALGLPGGGKYGYTEVCLYVCVEGDGVGREQHREAWREVARGDLKDLTVTRLALSSPVAVGDGATVGFYLRATEGWVQMCHKQGALGTVDASDGVLSVLRGGKQKRDAGLFGDCTDNYPQGCATFVGLVEYTYSELMTVTVNGASAAKPELEPEPEPEREPLAEPVPEPDPVSSGQDDDALASHAEPDDALVAALVAALEASGIALELDDEQGASSAATPPSVRMEAVIAAKGAESSSGKSSAEDKDDLFALSESDGEMAGGEAKLAAMVAAHASEMVALCVKGQGSGEYTLSSGVPIGSGASGKVYAGTVAGTDEAVAIKVIDRMDVDGRPDMIQQLIRELNITRKLKHPNIINLLDIAFDDIRAMLVMEMADGDVLFELVKDGFPLPEDFACVVMQQIIAAVGHCHDLGIYHRDLKLENILMTTDGIVKIADFGASKDASVNSLPKSKVGTISYMAPEVTSVNKEDTKSRYGAGADIWSLGVILYVLMCCKYPFGFDGPKRLGGMQPHIVYAKIRRGAEAVDFPETFSPELVELLTGIFTVKVASPEQVDAGGAAAGEEPVRWTLDQIRACAWLQAGTPYQPEVVDEDLIAEIVWCVQPPSGRPLLYHSVALLLAPDAACSACFFGISPRARYSLDTFLPYAFFRPNWLAALGSPGDPLEEMPVLDLTSTDPPIDLTFGSTFGDLKGLGLRGLSSESDPLSDRIGLDLGGLDSEPELEPEPEPKIPTPFPRSHVDTDSEPDVSDGLDLGGLDSEPELEPEPEPRIPTPFPRSHVDTDAIARIQIQGLETAVAPSAEEGVPFGSISPSSTEPEPERQLAQTSTQSRIKTSQLAPATSIGRDTFAQDTFDATVRFLKQARLECVELDRELPAAQRLVKRELVVAEARSRVSGLSGTAKYCKTPKGTVGVIVGVDVLANMVWLRLADGSHESTDVGTLVMCSDTELKDYKHQELLRLNAAVSVATYAGANDDCVQMKHGASVVPSIPTGGMRVFAKPRGNAVGRDMVKGYCKSRFDRTMNDAQTDIVIDYLCEQDPPILNRHDCRFIEIFEILDALQSANDVEHVEKVAQPEPELELEPEMVATRADTADYRTCLDREFVQKEIGWQQHYDRPIIAVFEDDQRRQAHFDYGKAQAKYDGTPCERLLNIDAIVYRRDMDEAEAMINRILRKATSTRPKAAPSSAIINHPGCWDFFLSHGQAAAGDQVKTLCFLLRRRGHSVWYDNEMSDRSTRAMEEGVKHSAHFLLFLSGDPA